MNAINLNTPCSQPALRFLSVLLLALTLTACGESLTGPEPPSEPPTETPTLTTVYDLNLTTRYIAVQGSCDKPNLLGNPTNGEFQYKYEITGEGGTHARQSDNYNSRTGKTYNRKPGENIDFSNRTYTWRTLSQTARINVKLFGAEWDGIVKDDRMKNRSGSRPVPFALGKQTHTVIIGATSSCQIRLFYDAEWTERVVQGR